MATPIPALGACLSRTTSGEQRLADWPQHKFDDDGLLWYDVPVGAKQSHPDPLILRPRRFVVALGAGRSAAHAGDWRTGRIRRAVAGLKRQRREVKHHWIWFHHKGEVN